MHINATMSILLLLAILTESRDILRYESDVCEEELRYILRSTITHDVLLLSDNERSDDRAEKIVEFVGKFSQKIAPTQIFPVGDETWNGIVSDLRLATSRTLAIYVYGAAEMHFVRQALIIKDYVTALSHYAHVPRILLILVLDQVNVDANLTLRQLWSFDYVDVNVFEVPPEKGGEGDILLPRLHRLDLFKNDYKITTDILNVTNWYPDKTKDMSGYPLKFFVDTNETIDEIAAIFQSCMNFTAVFSTTLGSFDMTLVPTSMFYDDLTLTLTEFSAAFQESKWCLYIPRMSGKKRFFSLRNVSVAVLLGIVITLIFWNLSILMSFDESLRHPMNTIAILFGAPIPTARLRLVERIILVALSIVSAQYISMVYTEMFGIFVVTVSDVNVEDWIDLVEIDLPIFVTFSFYEWLKEKDAGIPTVIQDRFYYTGIFVNQESEMRSTDFMRRSCYILNEIGRMYLFEDLLDEKGEEVMKLTDLCVYTTHVTYPLRTRSPYNNRLNDIILRVSESHIFSIRPSNYTSRKQRIYEREVGALEHSLLTEGNIVAIIIFAYIISFITFVAEVVIALLKRQRKPFCINWIFSRAH